MADGGEHGVVARIVGAIGDIPAADWNRIANPPGRPFHPFVSHAFLKALERSGSAAPETGWTPYHLVLDAAGSIVGAAPLYVKSDSFGEYVFDHHWADAYERAGGAYYPKLLCAVPFTPVPGPRLLAPREHKPALAGAIAAIARAERLSSGHVNFTDVEDRMVLADAGFLERRGVQFHWRNRGYGDYGEFLAALSARKRKALKRERRQALSNGVSVRRVEGRDIDEKLWDAFWTFYQDTGGRKWGRPYLTRVFFREIAETMADHLLFIVAEAGGRPIAGALNFIGGDALYGRYWGRIENHPFLHFEVCYHQAVEFAIEHRLARVEAGAQGEHKVARGYEPVPTHSAHFIADAGFRAAVDRHLQSERRAVGAEIESILEATPFRRDPSAH